MWRAIGGFFLVIFVGALSARGADATSAASDSAAPTMTVALFASLDPSEFKLKLDQSIRDSVAADLTIAAPGRVRRSDADPSNSAALLDDARKAGSRFLLTGSYAGVDRVLRITGEVIDVKSGVAIAAVKTTGSLLDLFTLEDNVADQVRRRVKLNPTPPPTSGVATDNGPPPVEPMLALRAAPQLADAYIQAYVAQAVAVPAGQAQGAYNYYYSNPYNGAGCCFGYGYGYGLALGYGPSYYGGHFHGGHYHGFSHGGFFGSGPSLYAGHGTAGRR